MKKITFLKPLSLLISLFCAVNFGFGQIVAWEMNGNAGNEVTVNATTLAANLNTSTLSRGGGLTIPGTPLTDAFPAASYGATITANDYLQFQVSASGGYQVSLSTLDAIFRRSNTGPNAFIWRYSTDGVNFTDIGSTISYTTNGGSGTAQTQINLSLIPALQNVASGTTITFRLYGWGATGAGGTFAIGRLAGNDLAIGGTVSALPCSTTTTWTTGTWSAGLPDINTNAVIDDFYDTGFGGVQTSFSACSLTVNSGAFLFINNGTYIEVENDVNVSGEIDVQSQGALVQNDDAGTFNLIGTGVATVNKQTPPKAQWYYYTYWSSPVVGLTIAEAFPNVDGDRRFSFNAANYLDQHTVGTTNGIPDDIDDNGNDWQYALGGTTMQPGVGYAATESRLHPLGASGSASFSGEFNTGDKQTIIYNNPLNILPANSWNLIGNPYPCAIDFTAFQAANSTLVDGTVYFWSQIAAPSNANSGNQQLNFSKNDYAIYTAGSGGIKTDAFGDMPNGYIPSCQAFFVAGLKNGNVTFTNAMRFADGTSNSQFFKNTKTKNKSNTVSNNKLWVNLTSDNGVFNQVLVAYVNGATNNDDGLFYDAPKLPSEASAILYSQIKNSTKKFAIQGKDANSINENEIINLGFKTTIDVATQYTISIDQLEGDFLNSNHIYLKDNLLNKTHCLSTSDYTFTSAVGEFNNRFEVTFSNQALAIEDVLLNKNTLKIVELQNDYVQFNTANNLNIKTVTIFDMLGRQLYSFKGNSTSETYKLSNLNNSIFVAKVELSNGAVISKKSFKK